VIEGFQMTEARRWAMTEWPSWIHDAWHKRWPEPGAIASMESAPPRGVPGHGDRLVISTLEGEVAVNHGDFIIQGVKGELYPCKPDIFEATYCMVLEYESVDDSNKE
jgi:hypothetical protein